MGNRCYFTIKSKTDLPQTYYMHWNGGLDTFAPLCKALFDHHCATNADALAFLKHLELRTELMPDADTSWREENGHYFIDLGRQTLEHATEEQQAPRWVPHLQDAFEQYLQSKIRAECRDDVRREYWLWIMSEADKYFGKQAEQAAKKLEPVFAPSLASGTIKLKQYPESIEIQFAGEDSERVAKLAAAGFELVKLLAWLPDHSPEMFDNPSVRTDLRRAISIAKQTKEHT